MILWEFEISEEFPVLYQGQISRRSNVLPRFHHFSPNSQLWGSWSDAFFLGIQAVESGGLKPAQALKVVEDQIRNDLGIMSLSVIDTIIL